ncbi:MAG TPA: TIGR03086 family metal-binding protein [Candidatus Binatia bacterium]|nr:TIGR03086 family metal-binding protein [Candidatus Binatia bacterium]
MTDLSDTLAAFDAVMRADQRLAEGVRPEQWEDPTPCPDWNVRQLVAHLAGGNRMFAAIIAGERAESPEALQRLRARVGLGPQDDPVSYFRESVRELAAIFEQPGFLDGTYPTPIGPRGGEFVVGMRITEGLVHGWDLARATGQPAGLPDDVAAATLETVRKTVGAGPRRSHAFGEEQPAPPDAPAVDRLAAFLGRRL